MATVRINHAQARAVSIEAALELITQVMYEIEFEAKIQANTGPYRTGTLSESIERDGPRVIGTGVHGGVGSNLPYAASVHDGARIHPIWPKGYPHIYEYGRRSRPQLKFRWRGKIRYFPQIPGSSGSFGRSHPGISSGKKYLTEPLRDVARRHRMTVTYI